MELSNLRFWVSLCSELIFTVPIFFGIIAWAKLNSGLKLYILFLVCCLGINIISIMEFLNSKSHNFSSYYTIVECCFLFQVINFFLFERFKKIIHLVNFCCFIILFGDFFLKISIRNTFSSTLIHLAIFVLNLYYIKFNLLPEPKGETMSELNLIVSVNLFLTYFLKTIFSFFTLFLLETNANYYLYIQIENFVNFFIIILTVIVSWAFYQFSKSNKGVVNE